MSPEAMRVAIAEACGIKFCQFVPRSDVECCCGNCGWNHGFLGIPVDDKTGRPIPDYLNDLNAMHEAEDTLTDQQLANMHGTLLDRDDCITWRATAAQRAEAFLRAIGKYKEAA